MANTNDLKPIATIKPFTKFCCTIGAIPSSYLVSLTYEEQLLWLCDYIQNTLIPALNQNGEAITELQQLYIQLKDYVDNYFDNLDVQEEINNKLDDMAEHGELQAIIEAYLQLNSLMCFDTIDDLKNATNLIDGSYARTLGYYEINDGGTAIYKITDNADDPNDMTIIEIQNNLYAILIYDKSFINVKQLGVHGDGETNDLTIVNNIMNLADNSSVLYFPDGEYIFNAPLNIEKTITIQGNSLTNNSGTKFIFNNTNGLVLKNSYINIKNINITGTNRNTSAIDLNNNIYGIIGIVNQYTDEYTNGGTNVENCNIHGFNTGIAIFSTRVTEDKWSGAYRTFKNCIVSYNEIGYLIKDGATYNSIIGGSISSNNKHGIFAETDTYYQNIEVIDTAMEINGQRGDFTNTVFTDFGLCIGKNTKIKLTNCYLELMYCYVFNDGVIETINSHIHGNVRMFGFGQIISNTTHAPFKTEMPYSVNFATRSTQSNLTITAPYGVGPLARIQSSSNSLSRFNFPDLTVIPYTMKNIEWLQLDFDFRINNGYQVSNLAMRPEFQIVGYTSNNQDGGNVLGTYSPKNCKVNDNNWHHFTMLWKPRIGISENQYIFDVNDLIYRLSCTLYFADTIEYNTPVDFSTNNLDMYLTNPTVTWYGKSYNGYNEDMNYLKGLIT